MTECTLRDASGAVAGPADREPEAQSPHSPAAPQIYVPRLPGIPAEYPYRPDAFGLDYEDVWLTAADGTRLHAWLMWPRQWGPDVRHTRPTVLFFQVPGSGESVGYASGGCAGKAGLGGKACVDRLEVL